MVEDDLTEILDAIRDADVLVAASPVRHGEVTRLLRTFIERTLCFIKPDFFTNPNPSRLTAGKRMVFILTQREPDEGLFADLYPKYDYFFRWCGFHDNYLIRACGVSEASDVEARQDIMKLTEETASRVMNGEGSVDSP
jgi:multimeric flavodoxin WrbA